MQLLGNCSNFSPAVEAKNTIYIYLTKHKAKQSKGIPVQAYYRPRQFQEVKFPRYLDSRHMKWLGCQPYTLATFTPQKIYLILISVRGWAKPRATVLQEELYQPKIPMRP